MRPVAPQKDGPQSNEDISSPDVQLIDGEGANRGVVRTRDAIAEAQELERTGRPKAASLAGPSEPRGIGTGEQTTPTAVPEAALDDVADLVLPGVPM